jgi:hypothetical protein
LTSIRDWRLGWSSEKKRFLVKSFEESLAQAANEGLPLAQVEMLESLMEVLKLCKVQSDKLAFNMKGWVKNPDQSEHQKLLYYIPHSSRSLSGIEDDVVNSTTEHAFDPQTLTLTKRTPM